MQFPLLASAQAKAAADAGVEVNLWVVVKRDDTCVVRIARTEGLQALEQRRNPGGERAIARKRVAAHRMARIQKSAGNAGVSFLLSGALDAMYAEIERRAKIEAECDLRVVPLDGGAFSSVDWEPGVVTIALHNGVQRRALGHVFGVALQHVRQRLDQDQRLRFVGVIRRETKHVGLLKNAEFGGFIDESDMGYCAGKRRCQTREPRLILGRSERAGHGEVE